MSRIHYTVPGMLIAALCCGQKLGPKTKFTAELALVDCQRCRRARDKIIALDRINRGDPQ